MRIEQSVIEKTKKHSHCPHGHKWTDATTYLKTEGKYTWKVCKLCKSLSQRRRWKMNPNGQRKKSRERYLFLKEKFGADYFKKYQDKYRNKEKARRLVRTAIANGSIIKPSKCSSCESNFKIHAHHNDYSKPLEVIWLCPSCHQQHHNKIEGSKNWIPLKAFGNN